MSRTVVLLVLCASLRESEGWQQATSHPLGSHRSRPLNSRPTYPILAKQRPSRSGPRRSSQFERLGSTDSDGYVRGSFGIGQNESIVLWSIVLVALVLGGYLDEDVARRIGDAQRSFYPRPPNIESARELRERSSRTREQAPPVRSRPGELFPSRAPAPRMCAAGPTEWSMRGVPKQVHVVVPPRAAPVVLQYTDQEAGVIQSFQAAAGRIVGGGLLGVAGGSTFHAVVSQHAPSSIFAAVDPALNVLDVLLGGAAGW